MSAFGSNTSAFGAKPFGQAGTSAFGQSNPNPQNPLFGGNPSQTSSSTSFGGFGTQSQAQPQNSAQGTSIFVSTLGQNPQQQQQQQNQGMPLFGGQQPGQSGAGSNLFGQPAANTQQPGSNLGSSIFGNTQNQQGSAFGQPAANTQQAGSTLGSSIFGNTQNQQSGLGQFGANTNNSTLGSSNLTGGLLFGKQASQQPLGSLSTPQASGAPPFTRSTKFNDLPDEVKKIFETIDTHIQGRIHISEELKQRKLGEEPTKGHDLVRRVHKDLVDTLSTMRSDVHQTRDLKSKVDQTVQDTIVATRIIDGFRNPQQHGVYLKNHATFPLEFYTRVTQQMQERLNWYKVTIEQIERKLSSAANQTQYTPQAIVLTLEAQHATFIALAGKTAALDTELQKLRTLYTQLWRAKTGSMRDPFNDLDRGSGGEFGLESLSPN